MGADIGAKYLSGGRTGLLGMDGGGLDSVELENRQG